MNISVLELADLGSVEGPQWLGAVIAVIAGFVVGAIVRWLVNRRSGSGSTVRILGETAFGIFLALGLYFALRMIGIDPAPLLAGAGIFGLTLAFALRDIAENYLSGILMGLRNPFRIGDQIRSGDHEGTVEELNLRYTTLRTYDGVRVLLPNGHVLKNPLINLTVNGTRRTEVALGVAYGTDLTAASRLAIEATKGIDGIDPERETQAWVESMDASWITIRVRFWHAPQIAHMWAVRSAVIIAVLDAMAEAGIEIPFENTTVNVVQQQSRANSEDQDG